MMSLKIHVTMADSEQIGPYEWKPITHVIDVEPHEQIGDIVRLMQVKDSNRAKAFKIIHFQVQAEEVPT